MKKFKDRNEAQDYVKSLPLSEIENLLVDLIMDRQEESAKRITISSDQFARHFRITGLTDAGTEERRGRPKKNE